jgi:hypothetical protein
LCSRFLRHRRGAAVRAAGARLQRTACELAARADEGVDVEGDSYAELEAAWPLLQAAFPLLIDGSNERLQQVCANLHDFLDFSGRWHRLLSLSQAAERKAQLAADNVSAGWRAYEAGCVHHRQGDPEAGRACEKRCLDHWGERRSPHQMAAVRSLRAIDGASEPLPQPLGPRQTSLLCE